MGLMGFVDVCLLMTLATTGLAFSVTSDHFTLRLLHMNDMHARFEQVSQSAGKCSQYEADNKLCYGGFARVRTKLNEEFDRAERENVPVISLNAGDTYQGTVWFAVYKWKIVSHFLKMLKIDAMSLGNHEFDDGIEGLTPFLHDVNIPNLVCNIDYSEEPEMMRAPLEKHLIIEKAGKKIGIIGYLTPDTSMLAETGKLKFKPEIESLRAEAKLLKEEGVDIIIALGHSGYEVDMEIAKEVPDVDVVVGGHSHSLLYTGKPPDSETPVDKYPALVRQSNGRMVAVVQAYAFTKYLGILDLEFDARGELLSATGNPILLNYKIPEDPEVLKVVEEWRSKLNESMQQTLGQTKVFLDGSLCRFYECNLGNLFTDAYIHYGVRNYSGPFWTNAAIAIQQAGGIRASINATGSNGTITREDVITSAPFFSPLSVVSLKGVHLLKALEWSVTRYDPNHHYGRGEFLQVSGLKIKYDLGKPIGSRVVSVRVRCSHCSIPSFEDLDPGKSYNVIMPTFLFKGGDSFEMFKEHGTEINRFEKSDTDVIADYFVENGIVYHGLDDRIEIINMVTSGALNNFSKFNQPYLFLFIFLLFFIN